MVVKEVLLILVVLLLVAVMEVYQQLLVPRLVEHNLLVAVVAAEWVIMLPLQVEWVELVVPVSLLLLIPHN